MQDFLQKAAMLASRLLVSRNKTNNISPTIHHIAVSAGCTPFPRITGSLTTPSSLQNLSRNVRVVQICNSNVQTLNEWVFTNVLQDLLREFHQFDFLAVDISRPCIRCEPFKLFRHDNIRCFDMIIFRHDVYPVASVPMQQHERPQTPSAATACCRGGQV